MRVILNQQEIETAIENYILENVTVPDDHRIDIDLKATRGDEGYTAEIDLLHFKEPEGSRAVDARIEPKPEAIAEGLGIVDKIEAAKAEATGPRRRGRPAGSKNRVPADTDKSVAAPVVQTPTETAIEEHPAHEEANLSATNEELIEQAKPLEVQDAAQEEAPVETVEVEDVAVEEPVEEAPVEPAEQAEVTEAVIPAEEAAPKPAARPSLFAKASPTPTDNVVAEPEPEAVTETEAVAEEPVEEPAEEEVQAEPEPNSEEALAAEAAVTEPAVEETPAPPAKRSLFANLTKPTN